MNKPKIETVVEPSKSDPGMWYWAVKIDGKIYADGEAETRMNAQYRAVMNLELLQKQQAGGSGDA